MQLTRAERSMLTFIARDAVPTWVLTGHLRDEHLDTFHHLHRAGLVEPTTSECRAYQVSALGRSVLASAMLPSLFDATWRTEED